MVLFLMKREKRYMGYATFCVRETMGFVKNRREAVFPKVDTPLRA